MTWREYWLRARIADISSTGVLVVELGAVPPVGAEVRLAFQIQGEAGRENRPVGGQSRILRTGRDFLVRKGIEYLTVELDPIEESMWAEIRRASVAPP